MLTFTQITQFVNYLIWNSNNIYRYVCVKYLKLFLSMLKKWNQGLIDTQTNN